MTAAVFALLFAAEVAPNAVLERVAARYAALKTFSLELCQDDQRATYCRAGVSGATKIRLDVGAGNRYYFRANAHLTNRPSTPYRPHATRRTPPGQRIALPRYAGRPPTADRATPARRIALPAMPAARRPQ